jgi:hypothetical protein
MKRLVKAFFTLISIFFLALIPNVAFAAQGSNFTWQRGVIHYVDIQNDIASNFSQITFSCAASQVKYNFLKSSESTSFTTYSIFAGNSLPVGSYVINGIESDGSVVFISNVKLIAFHTQQYDPFKDPKRLLASLFSLITLSTFIQSGHNREINQSSDLSSEADIFNPLSKITAENKEKYWSKGLFQSISLDRLRFEYSLKLSRYSTLLSRVVSDGGYLQFLVGRVVLIFPIAGAVMAVLASQSGINQGSVAVPGLKLLLPIILCSALDYSFAFIFALTFTIMGFAFHLYTNVYDFRLLLGLVALVGAPSLIAHSVRSLRKKHENYPIWDGMTDVLLGSLSAMLGTKGLIFALSALDRLDLPISKSANLISFVAGGAIVVRYALEKLAIYLSPSYLKFLSPDNLYPQSEISKVLALGLKGIIYYYFLICVFPISWRTSLILGLFLFPTLFDLAISHFKIKGSEILFKILPVGVSMGLLTIVLSRLIHSWVQVHYTNLSTQSEYLLIYGSIPGVLHSVVKVFAASHGDDDRWYMKKRFNFIYKTVGPLFLALFALVQLGVI